MSGIEVIGIVLSAAPLLIYALEAYLSLGKMRDAFKKKRLHVERMVRALKWQQTLLQSDVRIMLRNAGLNETTLDYGLGYGRLQDLLTHQDVQEAVSSYLGENWTTYLEIIEHGEDTLLSVAKAVKGFAGGSWIASGSLAGMVQANQNIIKPENEFWKRVKFSMHKDDLDQSIVEIDRTSQLLERLREKSQQEQQSMVQMTSLTSKAVARRLQKVQERAASLYQAVAQSWRHSCHLRHSTRLYLDSRIEGFEAKEMAPKVIGRTKIDFSLALEGCAKQSYHSCTVEVMDVNEPCHARGGAGVTFAPIPGSSSPLKRPEVESMCRVLNQQNTNQEFLKLYLEGNQKLSYEQVVPAVTRGRLCHVHGGRMVSLRDILQDPAHQRALHLRQRLGLAVLIASSTLQLHGTNWYPNLRKGSFLFSQGPKGDIDYKHPFVACEFDKEPGARRSARAELELLDLGILILELWHRQTFESFAIDSGLTLEDTYDSRQIVARKWIDDTKDEMVTSVNSAAFRCINCRFDAVHLDLLDNKLNASIYEGVVKALWENCKV